MIGDQLSDMERFDLQGILDEFEDVLQGKQTTLATHRINTTSEKPVRLPHDAYRESVTEELREMEESGIIEPSNSEWSSPIRLCVDYRRLNSVTPADPYPIPRTDELISLRVLAGTNGRG